MHRTENLSDVSNRLRMCPVQNIPMLRMTMLIGRIALCVFDDPVRMIAEQL